MWRIFSFPCMTIAGKSRFSLHVEKFQMPSHDRCGKIWNSPHLACVWCRKRRHICKIYAIFLKKSVFFKIYELCREIRFVVIYALLCGEKFIQKFSMWRKNDKYEVWDSYLYFVVFSVVFCDHKTDEMMMTYVQIVCT